MSDSKSPSNKVVWSILAAIIAIGAFFRFWHLGVPAFRADTILFWSLANRDVSLSDLLTRWFDVSGLAGQMPLAGFFMKLFLKVTGVAVTPLTVRIPFAIFGSLAIPMAYLAGRNLYDRWFGVILAAFVAFNTFAIQHSREAYVYAPILFGYFLYAAALFDVRAKIIAGVKPGAKTLSFFAAGVFFCAYSQVTGAFIVGTGALYIFWLLWHVRRTYAAVKPAFVVLLAIHAAIVAPLLIVAWGYGPILKQIFSTTAAGAGEAVKGDNPLIEVPLMLARMCWGTLPAAVILVAAAALGILYGLLKSKDTRLGMAIFFIAFQAIVFVVTRSAAQATFEPRYLSGAFPFIAVLLLSGLLNLPLLIPPLRKLGKPAGAVCAAVGVLYFSYPSFEATQLTGKVIPYWDIVRWADANLPERAPVLVDRWFEPWNEMRAHPGTNVIFTFTVPSEPMQNYLQFRWRDTATNFFASNPDAAYLEIAKTFFDKPEIGPWDWPRQHFARHHAITNSAGMVLRNWGVASRGDFYAANTNRLVVDFYYNTRDDMLARFKKSGQPLHWLFAGGWGYENSGPMEMFRLRTQSFIQWRLLNDTARLELINQNQQPASATLILSGIAAAGAKTVECTLGTTNARYTYAGPQPNSGPPMMHWKIPLVLPPGSSTATFTDPLWATTQRPLFINRIEIQPAEPASP